MSGTTDGSVLQGNVRRTCRDVHAVRRKGRVNGEAIDALIEHGIAGLALAAVAAASIILGLPVLAAPGLPVGMAGLAFAAVAAATISTLAANMNSTAAAFSTDFYERLLKGRNKLRCGKVCSVLVGVFGGAVAIVLANTDMASAYEQFQRYTGILTGGLACLFLTGIFMPRVNGFGAVCGLVANYIVTFGLDRLSCSGKPHLLLYGFWGMIACLAVAPLASQFNRKRKEKGTI